MIVYTPLDLPNIEPDDWDTFWDIWNQFAGDLVKERSNGAHSDSPVGRNDLWRGLDIYKNTNITPSWTAPFCDIKDRLPKLHNALASLPINDIQRIRLVSSRINVGPHSDDVKDIWVARAYLHYTAPGEQWFFTRPGDLHGEKTYITRPSETNWFAYNDKYCWHATDYDPKYPKILLQVFSSSLPKELVARSIDKYKDYTITYD